MKIKYTNLEIFTLLFFGNWEPPKLHFFSKTLVSNFSFRWNFANKKKKAEKPLPANALEN